jgi:uncharacterized protein with HEPN domain
MSRDFRLFLHDIDDACVRVMRWTNGLTFEQFAGDEIMLDAVTRRLEIIGEAIKQLPPDVMTRDDSVPWSLLARFRDVLAHAYFRLDPVELWNVVSVEIPELAPRFAAVRRAFDEGPPQDDRSIP